MLSLWRSLVAIFPEMVWVICFSYALLKLYLTGVVYANLYCVNMSVGSLLEMVDDSLLCEQHAELSCDGDAVVDSYWRWGGNSEDVFVVIWSQLLPGDVVVLSKMVTLWGWRAFCGEKEDLPVTYTWDNLSPKIVYVRVFHLTNEKKLPWPALLVPTYWTLKSEDIFL